MNENQDIREIICDMGYEDAVVFDNPSYDEAIIGVSEDGRIVYDFDLMVQCLVNNEDMTPWDAMDFISYNTIRALGYIPDAPIIMYSIEQNGGVSHGDAE